MSNNESIDKTNSRPWEIKTSSDLKFWHEHNCPGTNFFDPETMKFFGDTMQNFGARKINNGDLYELYRRKPVKSGLQASHYFDTETIELVTNKDRINGNETKGE